MGHDLPPIGDEECEQIEFLPSQSNLTFIQRNLVFRNVEPGDCPPRRPPKADSSVCRSRNWARIRAVTSPSANGLVT